MNEPLKWRKYLKLVEYGLLTEEELQQDVRRYLIDEADSLLVELGRRLEEDERSGKSCLYVVKLVSPYRFGQLPNLRITRKEELGSFAKFLHSRRAGFTEIWYCKTSIDPSLMSVAGRISFSFSQEPIRHIVEQVWRCSPRLIESFSDNFPYPYVRASRWSWGWRYEIEQSHLPEESFLSDAQLRRDFFQCMIYLEERRDRVRLFLEEVEKVGLRSVSLEYKVVGSQFSVIDWDTSDDSKLFAG